MSRHSIYFYYVCRRRASTQLINKSFTSVDETLQSVSNETPKYLVTPPLPIATIFSYTLTRSSATLQTLKGGMGVGVPTTCNDFCQRL